MTLNMLETYHLNGKFVDDGIDSQGVFKNALKDIKDAGARPNDCVK